MRESRAKCSQPMERESLFGGGSSGNKHDRLLFDQDNESILAQKNNQNPVPPKRGAEGLQGGNDGGSRRDGNATVIAKTKRRARLKGN